MPRRVSVKFDLDGASGAREDPTPLRVAEGSKRAMMRVGEIAEAMGVSTETARRYLRQGKIPVARKTIDGFVVYRAEFERLVEGKAMGSAARDDTSSLLLRTIRLLRQAYQEQAGRLAAIEEDICRQLRISERDKDGSETH